MDAGIVIVIWGLIALVCLVAMDSETRFAIGALFAKMLKRLGL